MTRRTLIAMLTSLLTVRARTSAQSAQNDTRGYLVSLIKVIANPNDFDGKRLRIVGYLANNGPDQALGVYLSEADGQRFVASNSVTIYAEETVVRHLVRQYIIFSGIYHAPDPRSEDNGHFDQVLNMMPWTAYK